MTWTGNLAAGATATITFSATVNNPDTGDKVLVTAITSPTAGSNCPASGPAAACGTTVTVLVPALTIAMTPGVSSTTPGSTVGYTVTITNSGQTPYTPATAAISLSGVLGDAAYNGNAAATAGAVSVRQPEPDLDRHARGRRDRDGHLLGHGQQPRYREPAAWSAP